MTTPSQAFTLLLLFFVVAWECSMSIEILSKSKIEKCQRMSGSDGLDCNKKIVVNMAVPSGSSGREASIVAELVEAEEENVHRQMKTIRTPPIITVQKSAAYSLYELTYIRDVPYKPVEHFVRTRKCRPDATAKVLKMCERLRDSEGQFLEHTRPICCPCGPRRRAPSSCGNFISKLFKGKANTAHCLRFSDEWYHVFGVGRRSLGFSVRIEVKTEKKKSEVVVGPENRTVLSSDNFLRVHLIGDFVGYTNLPTFEEFYLVIPRQEGPGQPQNLGNHFSKWMLLERVRFTLDGLECNKIGVGYEAFNAQPNFCSSSLGSCLQSQLWKFWDSDQDRISKKLMPQYVVEGRFERINQHPDAGTHSFSIGITEVLSTNLLLELSADDIEYVYQRSPGKIVSVITPTFEALTQFGTAIIMAKNTGKLEASYSLTFECSKGINRMEEQFFILKPQEVTSRTFKVYAATNLVADYICEAILKDSDFREIDRAECQFTTTATLFHNGTQITPGSSSTKKGISGFFESIKYFWNKMCHGFVDFVTGRTCRSKCSSFFDFGCHVQYLCLSWILLFGLLLASFPAVVVLLWLLHQKGFFDPIHDWWEERFQGSTQRAGIDQKHGKTIRQPCTSLCHTRYDSRHYRYDTRSKRRSSHPKHDHRHHHHHQYRRRHRYTSDSMDEKLEHSIHKVQKVAMKRQTKRIRY